ncbi:YbaB/EbfC family nucleoid-associated protein [Amycolatopsis sp. NPDC089917]|uniref:YbaB/EbfC family nucleoid-associated protein n=1 Tax=Amycolatopsis sp. NPDC089917 TaxID=3155187 RepID=UPI003428EBFB
MEPDLKPGEDLQYYLERQAREMQEKATRLEEAFATAGATVTSPDGSVTVTLAPNGALSNIQLGRRACALGEARLTATIMTTVREAQSRTARAVTSSVEAIVGDGEAVEMMKSFLPPEPAVDAYIDQVEKFAEPPEREQAPPPPRPFTPPPPPKQQQPPTRPAPPRRRPARDDMDEDEGNPW